MKTLRVGLVLWLILPLAPAVMTSQISEADTGLLKRSTHRDGHLRVV